MKKILLIGFAINFSGFCLTTGEAIKGDVFKPSPHQNEMAFIASMFLVALAIGFAMYNNFKLVKKTDS